MEIKVMANILDKNDQIAAEVNAQLSRRGIFVLNLLGSPGSGKTALLERTIAALKDELAMAVIEGDLFTDKDAERIARQGVPVVQINTGGGCHLDASMVRGVLDKLELERLELLIIENVGNLVCPAEFNIGEDMKATVLSVTEGEDKPLKYPDMFAASSLMLINKIDLAPVLDFDLAKTIEYARRVNPKIEVLTVSARTGEGFPTFYAWIRKRMAAMTPAAMTAAE